MKVSRQIGLVNSLTALDTIREMHFNPQQIDEESAKVLAFFPTLLTLLGLKYAEALADKCAKCRMPFKKQVRTIKENRKEYIERSFFGVSPEDRASVEDSLDAIVDRADSNIENLWNTVKKNIDRQHPLIGSNMLIVLTNAVITLIILRLAIKIGRNCTRQLEIRTNLSHSSLVDMYTVNVINACCYIVEDYHIPCTKMMNRSSVALVKNVAKELKLRIAKKQI